MLTDLASPSLSKDSAERPKAKRALLCRERVVLADILMEWLQSAYEELMSNLPMISLKFICGMWIISVYAVQLRRCRCRLSLICQRRF